MIYVFVGDKKLLKEGRPFVMADDSRTVIAEGLPGLNIATKTQATRFRTDPKGRTFRTADDYEYTVHAWVEIE